MSNLSVNQPSAFDSNALFLPTLNGVSNLRFEGQLTQTGNPLLGEQVTTYSTLSFDSGGVTYHYDGAWQTTANRALLVADVSASGSYNTIRMESGGALLATYFGASLDVDFGQSTGIPLVQLVLNLLGLLFQETPAEERAYANLNTNATSNLYALAFAGDDTLTGNGGGDTLYGGGGNDHIDGGAGADHLYGGVGDDIYVVDNAGDVVHELAGQGTDSVHAGSSYTLGDNVENLVLTGVADINGTGNAEVNVITGNDGANILDGLGGADTLIGGLGNDTYIVDASGDDIVEATDGGVDTVRSSASYVLAANLENLTLTGIGDVNGDGNAANNVLIGNAGANRLDGHAGVDQMSGGAGNDIYVVDNVSDHVTEAVNGGHDVVYASTTFHLGNNVEDIFLTGEGNINAFGNAAHNVLHGNAHNNILDGGAGADEMIGGAGNDIYFVDSPNDRIVESAGQGTDSVHASIDYALGGNLEWLVLSGNADIDGYGNALNNLLNGQSGDNLLGGGGGNDTIHGFAGSDHLYGAAGNDLLSGGAGHDILSGGAGADHFVFDTRDMTPDTITDYHVGTDMIFLEDAVFKHLGAPGTLAASHFATGHATTANQHIIYDPTNGWLSYDSDGSGAAHAVHFATLAAHQNITSHDFFVI